VAEFRDWREAYKLSRERLMEAKRNRVPVQPFNLDQTPKEAIQQIIDANARSERAAEFNETVKTDGKVGSGAVVETPHGRAKKTTQMPRGGSVLGSRPGTKAFYREKQVQPPEPYIERIDDFGEGGGKHRGGIKSTILSGKTGQPLKDQHGARRRMTQGAVTRHQKALANSEPAVETELP
jgi:hypothetical protein